MATPRRLTLRAQVISGPQVSATVDPIVRVWVDTGVFHLDSPFDYLVPQEFSELAQVGVRIAVPFNGREVEAIIIERLSHSSVSATIKSLSKILSPHPVATTTSLQLIQDVAEHWAGHPYNIVRSAIAPRVASVDKKFSARLIESAPVGTRQVYEYVAFDPYRAPESQIMTQVKAGLLNGCVLLIAPDESDISALVQAAHNLGINSLRLDSSLTRADRYENYLKSMHATNTLVIGSRGAVFAPVNNLSCIIVYKEASHEHYEIRTPGWNVRDVVNMRRGLEPIDVIFAGFVPSLFASEQIERSKLTYIAHTHRLAVAAFASDDGTLLPGKIFTPIRRALTEGPVLFLVPRKGYGNALLCAHCKNIATCTCGARLVVKTKGAAPSCTTCIETFPHWKCTWCGRDKQYIAGRGIDRAGEEISRAFSGYPLVLSFGDVIKSEVEHKPALVLATPGAIPAVVGGYSAVVIAEGLNFFSHPDLRAQERARELFFEAAAHVDSKGEVLLSIDQSHPIVAALTRWNPGSMIRRELADLAEIPLPPFVCSAVITASREEATTLIAGLNKAKVDRRLPQSLAVYGPSEMGKEGSKIVLYCSPNDRGALTSFLHELQRRRSIAGKDFLKIRIDPYSL